MPAPKSNSIVFGVMMIIAQVSIAALNGVFIRPIEQNVTSILALSPEAFFQTVAVALLTVLGFGLIFSYNKKLLFSGLGFALFIFALVIQYYPLINAFWTKTQIMGETVQGVKTPMFNNDIWYPYYLTRATTPGFFENHMVEAFKCAIAIIVAYSCVIGRAGTL